MQFNDTSNLTGLVQEAERITQLGVAGISGNTNLLKAFTARFNIALDRFFTLAFKSDGRWSFDDLNQTTAPLESINLVSGTEKYALDTFTSEIIGILRVEILDSTGVGKVLKRFDPNTVSVQSLPQYNSVAGTPDSYNLFGKYIYLYPKPSYSSTGGLSLYIQRNKSAFVSTDTTKAPGIPSIFHEFLARYASLPFLIERQMSSRLDVSAQIQADEDAIIAYFSHREDGLPTQISMKHRSSR